jgi:hypothetical protein
MSFQATVHGRQRGATGSRARSLEAATRWAYDMAVTGQIPNQLYDPGSGAAMTPKKYFARRSDNSPQAPATTRWGGGWKLLAGRQRMSMPQASEACEIAVSGDELAAVLERERGMVRISHQLATRACIDA